MNREINGYFDKIAMVAVGAEKRRELLEKLSKHDSDFDKMQELCYEFLKGYDFDYSILSNVLIEPDGRPLEKRTFTHEGEEFEAFSEDCLQADEETGVSLCPSLHALKLGTCKYFTAELEYFAKLLGIKYRKVCRTEICYDGYGFKKKSEGQDFDVGSELKPMIHHYIIMELGGEEYKIDIAGAIMARDFRKAHPDTKVRPIKFIFVKPESANEFEELFKTKTNDNEV